MKASTSAESIDFSNYDFSIIEATEAYDKAVFLKKA